MNKKDEKRLTETNDAASEEMPISKQVKREFEHAAGLGETEGSRESDESSDPRFELPSPLVSLNDAAFSNINVGQRGKAFGIDRPDEKPLNTTKKIDERDENRWSMDPASAEDFEESK